MIHNIEGKGIYNTIKAGQTFERAPLTADMLKHWVNSICENLPKGKRKVIIDTEGLQLAYNELGRDKFLAFISQTELIVGASGLDFIYSLGYPELKFYTQTGFNQIEDNRIILHHWIQD